MFFKVPTNNKGMTLVEVLLGMALSSAMALGLSQSISFHGKEITHYTDKMKTQQFKNDIMQVFSNGDACRASLAGLGPGDNVQSLVNVTSAGEAETMIEAGEKVDGRILSEINVANYEYKGGQIKSSLKLIFSHNTKKRITQTLPLYVTLDESQKIENCVGAPVGDFSDEMLSNTVGAACATLGGETDNDGQCLFSGMPLAELLDEIISEQMNLADQMAGLANQVYANTQAIAEMAPDQSTCRFIRGNWRNNRRCILEARSERCEALGGEWNEDAWPRCSLRHDRWCEKFGGEAWVNGGGKRKCRLKKRGHVHQFLARLFTHRLRRDVVKEVMQEARQDAKEARQQARQESRQARKEG